MKKMSFSGLVAGVVLLLASVVAADVRVVAVSGIVRAFAPGSEVAMEVSQGQMLAAGTEIRTAETGRVTLEVSPGNTVRLRENGRIKLLDPQPKQSRMQLLAGRVKGVFARLTGGERFNMEFSDNAVASVKGTEFTIAASESGLQLNTLFGAVEFRRGGKIVLIPQGCGAAIGDKIKMAALTEEQIQEGLTEWGEQAQPGDVSRGELKDFADAAKSLADDARDVVTQLKEEDFAAGRTLRDVHGNLTRVEQRIQRPYPDTIQFINLVKRNEYRYGGHFSYAGSGGARYDYMLAEIRFNADLPDALLDWPSFFAANADTVEPDVMKLTIANGRPAEAAIGKADTIVSEQRRIAGTDDDWSETIKFNDIAVKHDDDIADGGGKDSDEFWAWSTQRWYADANANDILDVGETVYYMNLEGYAINNDGKVLTLNDVVNSGTVDPIGVMRNSAVETIISVTDVNGASIFGRGNHSNIDLVVTPDIVLSIISKLAPQIPTLADSGSF